MGENFTKSSITSSAAIGGKGEGVEFEVFGRIAPIVSGKSEAEISELADRLEVFAGAGGSAKSSGGLEKLP